MNDCIYQAPKGNAGSNHPKAKLTEQAVCDMTDAYCEGDKVTYRVVAMSYGVSVATAYRAINRLSWKHVAHIRWS